MDRSPIDSRRSSVAQYPKQGLTESYIVEMIFSLAGGLRKKDKISTVVLVSQARHFAPDKSRLHRARKCGEERAEKALLLSAMLFRKGEIVDNRPVKSTCRPISASNLYSICMGSKILHFGSVCGSVGLHKMGAYDDALMPRASTVADFLAKFSFAISVKIVEIEKIRRDPPNYSQHLKHAWHSYTTSMTNCNTSILSHDLMNHYSTSTLY